MAKVLCVIQSIPHKELVGGIKSHKFRSVREKRSNVLVQQCANLNRFWTPFPKEVYHSRQGPTRVDDVLNQQNVLPFQLSLRIIHEANVSAGNRLHAIRRDDQKIHLQRSRHRTDEIAHENEAAFQ